MNDCLNCNGVNINANSVRSKTKNAEQLYIELLRKYEVSSKLVPLIEKQLALCEGSDWFWWFGDYNPSQSVSDFEFLYRQHLKNLYQLINVTAPEYLNAVISVGGGGSPATGGVMRQGHETITEQPEFTNS